MPESAPSSNSPDTGSRPPKVEITPELVREIADRVYAMLLEEIAVERERRRLSSRHRSSRRGGP